MDYLEDFSEYNPKTKLDAKCYVDNNLYSLIQKMNIDVEDYDDMEDVKKILYDYFTRFPDQVSRVSLSTFGVAKNYIVKTNNIGGVVKYR